MVSPCLRHRLGVVVATHLLSWPVFGAVAGPKALLERFWEITAPTRALSSLCRIDPGGWFEEQPRRPRLRPPTPHRRRHSPPSPTRSLPPQPLTVDGFVVVAVVGVDGAIATPSQLLQQRRLADTRHPGDQYPRHIVIVAGRDSIPASRAAEWSPSVRRAAPAATGVLGCGFRN